jgi:hypothetical protein
MALELIDALLPSKLRGVRGTHLVHGGALRGRSCR